MFFLAEGGMTTVILALDLGTTNWKCAAIGLDGRMLRLAHCPTPVILEDGHPCYDPLTMPEQLAALIAQAREGVSEDVACIALTGMAEAGLLLDRTSGHPLTRIWPWFDQRPLPLFTACREEPPFAGRETVTGLPNGSKYGIYKLLTMRRDPACQGVPLRWLGLVAYAGYLLTGCMGEEPTLAARTYAMNIHSRAWDMDFLSALALPEELFPPLIASGAALGCTREGLAGLPAGIPVCLCGHDHVCAAHAVGALEAGDVFLSTGTAQVILTTATRCTAAETATGLSYGPSPAGEPYTCLGSIQSAGGSVNAWKQLLYPQEGFDLLMAEAAQAPAPTGLIYLPFLAGSGAPHLNPAARGCLWGMSIDTPRAQVMAGVYEGIAMETRFVLERMGVQPVRLCVMGGLTRHHRLMQVLADVTGCAAHVPAVEEGTLYGAARLAAQCTLGRPDFPVLDGAAVYTPESSMHERYTTLYRERYVPLARLTAGWQRLDLSQDTPAD